MYAIKYPFTFDEDGERRGIVSLLGRSDERVVQLQSRRVANELRRALPWLISATNNEAVGGGYHRNTVSSSAPLAYSSYLSDSGAPGDYRHIIGLKADRSPSRPAGIRGFSVSTDRSKSGKMRPIHFYHELVVPDMAAANALPFRASLEIDLTGAPKGLARVEYRSDDHHLEIMPEIDAESRQPQGVAGYVIDQALQAIDESASSGRVPAPRLDTNPFRSGRLNKHFDFVFGSSTN